ncbi:MAG: pantoate--beta-alanine ligase [Gemmatimonadales bacterium]|jgi:pantoate--beta-alanine ligase
MNTLRKVGEVREEVARARADGRTVGFVPTMGYLHAGHLSLIDRCRELADYVVVSIYVNPLQFGPNEDLARYPRDMERDLAATEERGANLVFAPDDRELYPVQPAVVVTPRRLADRMCGLSRPGHFEGVLTVVCKLFGIVQPDVSVFGQKDFQQAVLIKRMVADLNLPVRIDVAPIVREADGIAMSSRNVYLSGEERARAVSLSRSLAGAVAAYRADERDPARLESGIRATLEAASGLDVEYVAVVSADELEPVDRAGDDTVVAVAVRLGSTRLIDNVWLARPDRDLERLLQNWGGRP